MAAKYDSARDKLLHHMGKAGWGNQSNGSVEAPMGHFCRITITDAERKEVAEAFEDEAAEMGALVPVGHFLVVEDNRGAVAVTEFPTEAAVTSRFNAMLAEFGAWESVQ